MKNVLYILFVSLFWISASATYAQRCVMGNCENGKGTYIWADKSRYDGEFVDSEPHGKGRFVWPDGSKYDGEWDTGYMHGKGILYDASGKVESDGYFYDDDFVGKTLQDWEAYEANLAKQQEEEQAKAQQAQQNQQTQENTGTVQVSGAHKKNEKRVALVIGNAAYASGGVLKNPVNDANLMAETLKELGFDVIKRTDAGLDSMRRAVRDFSKKAAEADVVLFYYAGHGVQIDGINYLLPIDAKMAEKDDVKYETLEVNFVLSEVQKYQGKLNIIILDACRNDPFKAWERGGNRGFAVVPAQASGTLIAFATSEGATAADGDGSNGVYTEELVKQMAKAQRIEDVFIETRNAVETRTKGQQSPQEWSKMRGKFFFKYE